jgi:HD-like signal output (HDOD) protein
MDLDAIVEDMVRHDSVRVPPYPSTALKLQSLISGGDYGLNELVDAMKTDQVFTGNILRLANSPFYRRGDAVTSLNAAVSRVGARELTRLAMAATVAQLGQGEGTLVQLRRKVWREGLTSALVAEQLARLSADDPSEAFVAGLLHDVGALLVLTCIEDVLKKWPESERRAAHEWWDLIDRFHVRLGLSLAVKWQLPDVLQRVIAHHHDVYGADDRLTRRVALADQVVSMLESSPEVPPEALAALEGMQPEWAEAMARVIPRIPAFINAFEAENTPGERPAPRPAIKLPEPPPLPEGPEPGFSVELRGHASRGLTYPVTRAARAALCLRAPHPLAPNLLVELAVKTGLDVRFWAVVQRCASVGDQYEVQLAPFALSPEVARAWETLVSAP